jgi:hypothetical protein
MPKELRAHLHRGVKTAMVSCLGTRVDLHVHHRGALGSTNSKSYSSSKCEMTTFASADA